jgi:hypothetical protein
LRWKLLYLLVLTPVVSVHAGGIALLNQASQLSSWSRINSRTVGTIPLDIQKFEKTDFFFRDADEKTIVSFSNPVTSPYDPDLTYDVSQFYQPQKSRYRAVLANNYQMGFVFLAGVDTGHRSSKLTISPALMLGGAYTLKLSRYSTLSLAGYKWAGGAITESPCLDEFDREYMCAQLIAWTDYKPKRHGGKYAAAVTVEVSF